MHLSLLLTTLLAAASLFQPNFTLTTAITLIGNSTNDITASSTDFRPFPVNLVDDITHVIDWPTSLSSNDKMRLKHEKIGKSYINRRRRSVNYRQEAAVSLFGDKIRRSLNIFGHDGENNVRPKSTMLYSVADRRFVCIGLDGTVKTSAFQDPVHGGISLLCIIKITTLN